MEWMQRVRGLDSRNLGNFADASRERNSDLLKSKPKARGCAVKKSTKMRRDSVSPFRDKLWKLFQETAKGMDGADVVVALKQAGEEIWAVGIDDTYSSMSHQDDEPLGNAFDISWLTVVCIKLKEMKQGKKPKVRIHT
jgi:hypothetical protein